MALGQFGSLTYNGNKNNYGYSISNDFAMNTILKTLGKANFTNPIVNGNQKQEAALENLADDGHVEVLS